MPSRIAGWRAFVTGNRADAGLAVVAMLALASGALFRLLIDWDTPLWVDEVWTGTIAMQPTVAGLIRDMNHEIGGPIYYGLAWIWGKAFGYGNTALRLPSLLFALVTPVVALRWWEPGRRIRLVWASLLLLWIPDFYYATEARSYSLVYLLGAVQAVAAVRLLRHPSLGRAFIWSIISTIAVLTHYHAALIVAFQGLLYLIWAPRTALRSWPAIVPFGAPALWLIWQLPLLTRLTTGNIRWHPPLTFDVLKATPLIIIGGNNRYAAGVAAIMMVLAVVTLRRQRWHLAKLSPEFWVAFTGLAALTLVYAMGFVRPSFRQSYLFPYAAAALLAPALMADRLGRDWPWVPTGVVSLFFGIFAIDISSRLAGHQPSSRWFYSWQGPSERIAAWRSPSGGRVRRTVFFLDNPVMEAADRDQLRRVGGFFFARAHYPMETRALVVAGLKRIPDPNQALIAAADPASAIGATALIWIFDDRVIGSVANVHGPDGRLLARYWSCLRQTRDKHVSIITCLPKPLVAGGL